MITYIIMRGDTLWNIARKHGITLDELIVTNPQITNPNLIYPGQIINIPNKNNIETYTVLPGDTMWDIANMYGVSLNNLVANNPQINNPNLIHPGQIINISSINNGPGKTNGVPSTPNDIKALEEEVIRLVNVERSRAGISTLTENEELRNIARLKSQDFVDNNYFSHNSPTYGSPFEMLDRFNVNYTAAAENIASGQRSALEVMNTWMNSPGHKANILNTSFNQIGVGIARDSKGKLYWTQIFIRN